MRHVRTLRHAQRLGVWGFDPAHCPRQVRDGAPRDQMHGPPRRRPSHAMPGRRTTSAPGNVSNTSGGSMVRASPSIPMSTGSSALTSNRGVVHSNQPG